MHEFFRKFTQQATDISGSPWTFLCAVLIVIAWVTLGPLFQFSDTWQLIISTVSSVITFLMVFIIQSSQNRDSKAIQLKLDELIRAVGTARNHLVRLEEFTDDELDDIEREFKKFRQQQSKKKTVKIVSK